MSSIYKNQARRQRYENHLRSDYWQRVRQAVYDRQVGLCARCHGHLMGKFDTHHENYSYFGRELDGLHTCVAVHRSCHEELHSPQISWAELIARVNRLGRS